MTRPRRSTEPHDDLTRLADELIDTIPDRLSHLRVVVMISDDKRGGIGLGGYDRDSDVLVDIFVHLEAILATQGKKLLVTEIGRG